MTKRDLVEEITSNGRPFRQTKEVVDALLDVVKRAINNGEDVVLSGFGTFSSKETRQGADRRVPTFTPSKKFKDQINS